MLLQMMESTLPPAKSDRFAPRSLANVLNLPKYWYQSLPKLNELVKIGHYEFQIIKKTMTKIELVKLKVTS